MATNKKSGKQGKLISDLVINGLLLLLVLGWTVPTIGILVSSFRNRFDISTSGWWTIFPHKDWVMTEEFPVPADLDRNGVMEISGVTGTFEEFRKGVASADGKKVTWIGNKRLGTIQIQEKTWKVNSDFTLENYSQVLAGKAYEIKNPDGSTQIIQGDNFVNAFLNSLAVAIPSTVIPILIAAFAAYGFAWMRFPGRRTLLHHCCSAIGCTIADCLGPHFNGLCEITTQWYIFGRLVSAHWIWLTSCDLSAVQLHQRIAQRYS